MKIYFAGSITGGRQDQEVYAEIIPELAKFGTVLTEHFGSAKITSDGETHYTPEYIFCRDVGWVTKADVLVAEVTQPSLGVGYELGIADKMGKRILCLYRHVEGRRLSAMITGNKKLIVEQYQTIDEARAILEKFFQE